MNEFRFLLYTSFSDLINFHTCLCFAVRKQNNISCLCTYNKEKNKNMRNRKTRSLLHCFLFIEPESLHLFMKQVLLYIFSYTFIKNVVFH